jgi:hypothetical protein
MKKLYLFISILYLSGYISAQTFNYGIQLGSNTNIDLHHSVKGNGNFIYSYGQFSSNLFIPQINDTLTASTVGSTFVLKHDEDGHVLWAKKYDFALPRGLVFQNNSLYLFGATAIQSNKVFVLKMDSSGVVVYNKIIEGNNAVANKLLVDATNNLTLYGQFQQQIDLDPDTNVINLRMASGGYDIFKVTLNPSGNFVSGSISGGSNSDFLNDVEKSYNGVVYTCELNYNFNNSYAQSIKKVNSNQVTE